MSLYNVKKWHNYGFFERIVQKNFTHITWGIYNPQVVHE